MATVPRVTQRSVAPAGAPNVTLQNSQSAGLLSIGARQSQAAGAALGQAGGEMEAMRREAVAQANALRVDDALNQLNEQTLRLTYDKQDGYESQTGVNAVTRQSGKPLADEYMDTLKQSASTIADSLANPDQRRLFAMKANNVMTMFYGKAKDFEGQQYRAYSASTREAAGKQSSNAIALNPTDPEYVAFHTTRLRASIEGGRDESGVFVPGVANFQGKSAAWAKQAADEAVSAAYASGVKMLMEKGDLNGAMAFRQRYSGQLLPKDILTLEGALEREYDTKRGVVAADQAFERAQASIAPNDFDRLVGTIKDLESKGQRFGADGKILLGPVTRSGERAMGEMQVMPSTAKNPGYGIKPANLEDPDDVARVGVDKAQMLVKRYGDVRKVLAAYNWGEDNVDKAVKKNGAAWLELAPPETKSYVERGIGIYDRPNGGAQRPPPTREEVQRIAEASVGANPSEAVLKATRARVVQRFEDHEKALAQRETETVILAQQQLLQNPDFSALPASTRSALAQYAPGKVADLMAFAGKVRTGQPVETNWNVYADLRDAASRAPQEFAKTDLRAYSMSLAPAQREQLLDLQEKLRDPKNAPSVASLDAQLATAHNLLGFKANDREKKGQFDSVVMQEIAAEQARKGSVLTYEERQKVLDRLMTTGEVPSTFWNSSKRLYEVTGTEDVNAFRAKPSDVEKAKIQAALKRAGRPVTDAEVNRLYRMKAGL